MLEALISSITPLQHPELCSGRKDKSWAARETPATQPREKQISDGRDGIIYLLAGAWSSGRLMNQVNKANFQPLWGNLENVV